MSTGFRSPFIPLRPNYGELRLPIYQSAVIEGVQKTQAPYKLVHHSALVAVVLSVHGLIDFGKPTGGTGPVAIMSLTAAPSGERKSTVDAIYLSAIRAFEHEQRAGMDAAKESFEVEQESWQIQHSEWKGTLRRAIRLGEGIAEAQDALRQHRKMRPKKPKVTRLLYQDSSMAAILKGLNESPCGGLISDEGAGILAGQIFSEHSKLNSFWSGSPVTHDRIKSGNYFLKDIRLTTGLMVQPGAIARYIAEKGDEARDSGLLARMIVCVPQSTQGGRFVGNAVNSDEYCTVFADRVKELLTRYATESAKPGFERQVVKFSPMAATAWLRYFDYVEAQIQPGGRYSNAGDHASKLADNVGRVAAALHYFEGFEGDISIDTYVAAHMLVDDASFDFASLFLPGLPGAQEAALLDQWFTDNLRLQGQWSIAKSLILNRVPNMLRRRAVLGPVLENLSRMGRIRLETQNGTCFINLCPPAVQSLV